MTDKFDSSIDHRTVDTIILQSERPDHNIDLNPKYQRGIVWTDEKQSAFINSVIRGIVPNNLILNIDHPNEKQICLDGKQRMTSLIRFKNNQIPCIIENDNGEEEHLFFNQVPQDYSFKGMAKTLTSSQRTSFLHRKITFVEYKNLSYEDQTDIFTRIQHGIALTDGEKITSLISNEKTSDEFNKFCMKKKSSVETFTSKREQYKIIILNAIIMCDMNKLQIPNRSARNNYLKKLTWINLRKVLVSVTNVLDYAFSTEMLNHQTLGKRLPQNIYYTIIFILAKERGDLGYKNLMYNSDNQKKFRSVIRKYEIARKNNANKINAIGNKSDVSTLKKIKEALLNGYKNITSEQLTDDEDEEVDDEEIDDDEKSEEEQIEDDQDEDSEKEVEIVIKSNKMIKTSITSSGGSSKSSVRQRCN